MRYRKTVYIVTVVAAVLTGISAYNAVDDQTVIINEVCANNKTIIYDSVGDYSDYIELYNPSDKKINLDGYALSDSKKNLRKFEFTGDITIEGKQYLLVWANGENGVIDETGSVYLGFSLKAGETLYLSNRSGEVIDVIALPETGDNKSYSKINFGEEWTVDTPSPGEENGKIKNAENVVNTNIGQPVFSQKSGFYSEPFYLEMSADEGTEIYYTVNGETPTIHSKKYTSGILIDDISDTPNVYSAIKEISSGEVYIPSNPVDKANIIRAVAIDKDGGMSEETVATYFVGYSDKTAYDNMMTISLITDPDNLFSADKGIYVRGNIWENNVSKQENLPNTACANYNKEGIGWERIAHMELYDINNASMGAQDVGIRIHGGWSTSHNQKSFNVYLRSEYDKEHNTFANIIGNQENTFMLRTGGYRDAFQTKIRDVLNQSLVSDREIAVQNYIPCQVFLNGEYWGVYNIQERVCADFIESKYGVDKDNIILLKNKNVVQGEDDDLLLYEDIVSFAEKNDLSVDKNYDIISNQIDIQSYIDYYCFQIYVANCDSVSNNYALWRSREILDRPYCDGKWRWILYDTDDSAGMTDNLGYVDELTHSAVDSFVGGHWSMAPLNDTLFSALIENDEFKEQFVKTFMDMANYNFAPERVNETIDGLYDLYHEAVVLSHQRFVEEDYSEQAYLEKVEKIRTFYNERYEYITKHMQSNLALGEKNALEIHESAANGGTIVLNSLKLNSAETFSGEYFSDYPVSLSAESVGGFEFQGWEIDGKLYSKDKTITLEMSEPHDIVAHWEEKK